MTKIEDLPRSIALDASGTQLKTSDVMAMLGRSRGYIYKLCRSGRLAHVRRADGSYRFDGQEVADWIATQPKRRPTKRLLVSIHEAAHAVTCLIYGIPFETVDVFSENDPRRAEALGRVTGNAAATELHGPDPYFLAVTYAASLAAEMRMRPRVHRVAHIMGDCGSDWGTVFWIAKALQTTPARIYSEARKAVKTSWVAIEVVAKELDRVGKLDYEEVKRLYEACSIKTNPIQLKLDFPIDLGS